MPAAVNPMRSSLINETFWVPYCEAIFKKPIGPPKVKYYLDKYGGLDITGKNIFFFNAGEDPWQYAGMRSLKNPDT